MCFIFPLFGTVVLKMDIPELVGHSCAIVVGEVVQIDKEFESIPHTENVQVLNAILQIRIEKVLKACSSIHEGDVISVKRMGGQIGDLDMRVPGAPTFKSKRDVLLFLTELPETGEHVITGFSQGKFRVMRDSKTGEEVAFQDKNARSLALVDQKTGREVKSSTPPYINLEDLVNEIKKYVQE
ncbi:MAG: hypothetical protein HYZ61_04745 [Candidatus Andersenbacteria bacterium]|nr:hypothetical protein [Candidatus Andersenbacteria bacterium]